MQSSASLLPEIPSEVAGAPFEKSGTEVVLGKQIEESRSKQCELSAQSHIPQVAGVRGQRGRGKSYGTPAVDDAREV